MRRLRHGLAAIGLAIGLALAPLGAATLLPNGEQTFVDSNGAPLAAGKVYFYIPSTTTPKTTWRDAGQTVANANPVVLDSAGRAIIYGSGTYRQVVKDVFGNTVWDQLTQGLGSGGLIVNSPITGNIALTSCGGLYPINNLTGGAITVTMPTAPGAGDSCQFTDVAATAGAAPTIFAFGSNSLNLGGNQFVLGSYGASIGFTWLGTPAKWDPN